MSVSRSTDKLNTSSKIVYLVEKIPNWIIIICKLVAVGSALKYEDERNKEAKPFI